MPDSFIKDLLQDISQQKQATADRISRLQPWKQNVHSVTELPIEATLGTMWMQSDSGSVIEFYTWIDPVYCHGPMYETEEVHMTQVTFHTLAKYDRAFLKRWEDFTLYDLEMYHRLIATLQRAGFRIMLDPANYREENEQRAEREKKKKRVYRWEFQNGMWLSTGEFLPRDSFPRTYTECRADLGEQFAVHVSLIYFRIFEN
jgi:hypothetical protein